MGPAAHDQPPTTNRPCRPMAVGIKTSAPAASTAGSGVIVHPESFSGRSCARSTEPYYEIWTAFSRCSPAGRACSPAGRAHPARIRSRTCYSMGVSGNGEHLREKVVVDSQALHAQASERGESRREATPRTPRVTVGIGAPDSALAASTGPGRRPAGRFFDSFRTTSSHTHPQHCFGGRGRCGPAGAVWRPEDGIRGPLLCENRYS